MDAQLASDLLFGFIGLLALVSGVSVILSFWFLGRSAYRKE